MKNPYSVLHLTESASEEVLRATYESLRNRYSEDRFLPGEQGNEAAMLLSELEEAWRQISDDLARKSHEKMYDGNPYGHVDQLIKDGRYDEAQAILDSAHTHDAHWHYMQAMVYYKRNWTSESKRHLEQAIAIDPYNIKYRTALDRMNMIHGNPRVEPANLGFDGSGRVHFDDGGGAPVDGSVDACGSCARCCALNLCINCLCSSLRCC
ncbi:MAG: tetratricopeptide repeat protein [Firmicutes bacterium]|nr:tetratricopeptide repeat protein [Bacillota bacterium]